MNFSEYHILRIRDFMGYWAV